MMVFLSAVCATGIAKTNFKYSDYLKKRAYRLIIPVWIFLSLYYVGIYFVYYLPSISEILLNFTFISDRYVWIIRILLILALIAPIVYALTKNLPSNYIFLCFSAGLTITEWLFSLNYCKSFEIVIMTLPYALVYMLGINLNKFSRLHLLTIAIMLIAVFVSYFVYLYITKQHIILTSEYKYPPRIYYISYGLGITLLLWLFRFKILIATNHCRLTSFLKYVGSHTYWLYLYHIPMVDIIGDKVNPFISFVIIFTLALSCVYIQDSIVKRYIRNTTVKAIFNG